MHLLRYFHEPKRPKKLRTCKAALAIIALASISACGQSQTEPRLTSKSLKQATAILEDVKRTETRLHPEHFSHLGLTYRDDELALKERLTDTSQAAFERQRLLYIDLLEEVSTFPPLPSDHPLNRDLRITYDVLNRLVALQNVNSGPSNLSNARPYTIDPFNGAWIETPTLLWRDHALNTGKDADAYLARLSALADALDDTRFRLQADAKVGALAPAPLLIETKAAIDRLIAPDDRRLNDMIATYSVIISSIQSMPAERTASLTRNAEIILDTGVRPAYARLSETLESVTKDARAQAGLWSRPDGDRLYTAFLQRHLSDIGAPSMLHTAALQEVDRRNDLLKAIYANFGIDAETPAARYEAFIVRQTEQTDAAPISDTAPATTPNLRIDISAIAPFRPSRPHITPRRFNGSRPLQVIATPQMLALWPDIIEPALDARAHAFDPLAYESSAPQTRALIPNHAYRAALQSHVLNEAYRQSPPARESNLLGWHMLYLLEAAMAVADTGLHHERWTLERTQSYLQQTVGLPNAFTRQITLEIIADPGRAAAHIAAYRRLRTLQARARAVIGNRYNEGTFQEIVMRYGPRPFAMIEADVERWYEAQLDTAP